MVVSVDGGDMGADSSNYSWRLRHNTGTLALKTRKTAYEVDPLGLSRFLGSLAFLVLFIADHQMNAGVDRLSTMKLPSQFALDAEPHLKLVSERSPYMRTER